MSIKQMTINQITNPEDQAKLLGVLRECSASLTRASAEKDLVKEAVQQYPNRFYALAGLDPTEGMNGVRALEKAVKEDGFIGAHFYPHWFELAPDHARWYPFYAKCVELDIPVSGTVT